MQVGRLYLAREQEGAQDNFERELQIQYRWTPGRLFGRCENPDVHPVDEQENAQHTLCTFE
jgi:hypothetical protein